MAISALRRAPPFALAADPPAGPQGSRLLNWSTAEVEIVKVPVADTPGPITGPHDLAAKPFSDQALLGPLLESCFADLTERRIEQAGHMLHHDQPEALARVLEEFLRAG